jgi:hypothetical protein
MVISNFTYTVLQVIIFAYFFSERRRQLDQRQENTPEHLLSCQLGGNGCKVLSVRDTNLLFQVGWHARTIRSGKRSGSVRRGSVWLVKRKHFGFRISQRNKNHAVMGKEWHNGQTDGFLSTTLSSSGLKNASCLANHGTILPERTSRIHKGFDLSGIRAVSTTDTKHDSIVVWQFLRRNDGVVLLGWSSASRKMATCMSASVCQPP